MPTDDHPTTGIATDAENEHRNRRTQPKPRPSDHAPTSAQPQKRSWFAIPTPIRYLFDHTPLITYARSSLPIRSPSDDDRHQNTLYVFTTPADAACGAPSYNPGCLKWQVSSRCAAIVSSPWEFVLIVGVTSYRPFLRSTKSLSEHSSAITTPHPPAPCHFSSHLPPPYPQPPRRQPQPALTKTKIRPHLHNR